VKYYEHALLVLGQIEGQNCDGFIKWLETAKVRVSLGQIYKQMKDRVSAFDHFQKAAECISRQQSSEDLMETWQSLLEEALEEMRILKE
jgi:tetratricopeptide (TPR) repeat protein